MTTGSLINNVMGQQESVKPEIGDGATMLGWTDRIPGTLIAVLRGGREIVVQEDHATRTDSNGMSDAQSYEFEQNVDGATCRFTLRKNGKFVQAGQPLRQGMVCLVGQRSAYYDYSF